MLSLKPPLLQFKPIESSLDQQRGKKAVLFDVIALQAFKEHNHLSPKYSPLILINELG